MIRGIHKQMIVMKPVGGLYETVCFILRNEARPPRGDRQELAEEADRILASVSARTPRVAKRHRGRRFLLSLLIFIIGCAIGFGTCAVLGLF